MEQSKWSLFKLAGWTRVSTGLSKMSHDLGSPHSEEWGAAYTKEGKFKDVLLIGSPWNSISSYIEWAEELKKYLNVLQRKKAWNSRNSLSLATTISKGNPGTASLWRRILEIVSEPRSNKEQKWVFVMSTSSLLFPTPLLSGNCYSLVLSFSWPIFRFSRHLAQVRTAIFARTLALCGKSKLLSVNS